MVFILWSFLCPPTFFTQFFNHTTPSPTPHLASPPGQHNSLTMHLLDKLSSRKSTYPLSFHFILFIFFFFFSDSWLLVWGLDWEYRKIEHKYARRRPPTVQILSGSEEHSTAKQPSSNHKSDKNSTSSKNSRAPPPPRQRRRDSYNVLTRHNTSTTTSGVGPDDRHTAVYSSQSTPALPLHNNTYADSAPPKRSVSAQTVVPMPAGGGGSAARVARDTKPKHKQTKDIEDEKEREKEFFYGSRQSRPRRHRTTGAADGGGGGGKSYLSRKLSALVVRAQA